MKTVVADYKQVFADLGSPQAHQLCHEVAAFIIGNQRLTQRTEPGPMTIERAAAHEAGHAVILAALGVRPSRVLVEANGDKWGGLVINDDPGLSKSSLTTAADAALRQLLWAGGYVAEQVAGVSTALEAELGATHELALMACMAQWLEINHGTPAAAAFHAALGEADHILRENVAALDAVRAALVIHKQLPEGDIAALMAAAKPYSAETMLTRARRGGGDIVYPQTQIIVEHAARLAITTQTKEDATRRAIGCAMTHHPGAVLAFSGGKESVVLAHMLEPYRDRVTLAFVNTGAMLPHMEQFVRGYADRFNLVELRSDQAKRFAIHGAPSKIIPIHCTRGGVLGDKSGERRVVLSDPAACCHELRHKPLTDYLLLNAVPLVIHGQRAEDRNPAAFSNLPPFTTDVLAPLAAWTEEEVMAYASAHKLELPEQYAEGYADSVECWSCTAEIAPERFAYLTRRYPEQAKQLAGMASIVYGEVERELDRMRPTFEAMGAFVGAS